MVAHKDLTDAHLHEPKGVASASVDTVYVADGSGSGTWKKVGVGSVDTTSVKNANREQMFGAFIDIGTAGSRYQVWARPCKVVNIYIIIQTATAGAATVLTFRNDAGTAMGTVNIPNGAVAGSTYLLTPVSNNTFLAGNKIQIDTDGGTSTNTNASFTFDLEWQ